MPALPLTWKRCLAGDRVVSVQQACRAEARAYELGDPRTDVALRPDADRVHRGQRLTSARDHGDAMRGRAWPEAVAGKKTSSDYKAPRKHNLVFISGDGSAR